MIFNGKKTKQVPIVLGGLAAVFFAIVGMLASTCSYADCKNEEVLVKNIDAVEACSNCNRSSDSISGIDDYKDLNGTREPKDKSGLSLKSVDSVSVEFLNKSIDSSEYDLDVKIKKYANSLYPGTFVISFTSERTLPDAVLISIDFDNSFPDNDKTIYYIFTMDKKGNFNLYNECSASNDNIISFETESLQNYYISTINLEEAQAFVSSLDN